MLEILEGVILNEDDFESWKTIVEIAFDGEGISEFLEIDYPIEPLTENQEAFWFIRGGKALDILKSTLSDIDKDLVKNCSSCYELVARLQKKYEVSDESLGSYLIGKLTEIPDPSVSVEEILTDMANLKDSLDKTEDKISDKSFIQLTIMKFPDSFKAFAGPCLIKPSLFTKFDAFYRVALDLAQDFEMQEKENKEIVILDRASIEKTPREIPKIRTVSAFIVDGPKVPKKHWVISNYATHHCTPHKDLLSNYQKFSAQEIKAFKEELAKESLSFPVPEGFGEFVLKQKTMKGDMITFKMKVYHFSYLPYSLFSTSRLSTPVDLTFRDKGIILDFPELDLNIRGVPTATNLSAMQDETERY